MKLKSKLILAASIFMSTHTAWTHHGDAGRFEEETTTIVGTVLALQLINPHSLIILSVEGEGGEAETWQAELGGPNQLTGRHGWNRATLVAGDEIYLTGRLLKSGEPFINLTERARIVKSNGCQQIYVSNSEPTNPMPC
jgi:hypothetical protein